MIAVAIPNTILKPVNEFFKRIDAPKTP